MCLPRGRTNGAGQNHEAGYRCAACKAGQERAFLWDGETRGFGVVAFKSGKKVFIAQYRARGRSRRQTIGTYGTMLLDDTKLPPEPGKKHGKIIFGARTLAGDVLTAARKGNDPLEARRDKAAVRTFKALSEDFLTAHGPKLKDRTKAEYAKLLEAHVYPALGSQRLDELTANHVGRLHAQLADRPRAANHCLAVVSSIWNWAAKRHEVQRDKNPAREIERYPEEGKERFLSTAELAAL